MDDVLLQRLSRVELDFMSAVSEGEDALLTFEQNFLDLRADIQQGVESKSVHPRTLESAHIVAARVALLTESLLELQIANDDLSTAFKAEVQSIVERSDCTIDAAHRLVDTSPDPRDSLPSYIEAAYEWLMGNIHDPYPSQATKVRIARASRTSIHAIDKWFTQIRSKMGWSKICKEMFTNDRKATVDAARRTFLTENSYPPLAPHIRIAFFQMRCEAALLYQHKLTEKLSCQLNASVKGTSPENVEQITKKKAALMLEQRRKDAEAREARKLQRRRVRQIANRRAAAAYPSPDRSIHDSPAPSTASLPLEEQSDFEEGRLEQGYLTPISPSPYKRRRLSSPDFHESASSRDHSNANETILPIPTDNAIPTDNGYRPLTPVSNAGDLRDESEDQVAEWTNSVFHALSHSKNRTVSSPCLFASSTRTFLAPSPPSTPCPSPPLPSRSASYLRATSNSPQPKQSSCARKRRCDDDDDDESQIFLPRKRSRHSPDTNDTIGHPSLSSSPDSCVLGLALFHRDSHLPYGSLDSYETACEVYCFCGAWNVPAPKDEISPREVAKLPGLSQCNALQLHVDVPSAKASQNALFRLRLCPVSEHVSEHYTSQSLKTFHTNDPPSPHACLMLNPISSLSSLRYLAVFPVASPNFHSALAIPFDCSLLSSRAFLGARFSSLSLHQIRAKLERIRTHEAAITLLRPDHF